MPATDLPDTEHSPSRKVTRLPIISVDDHVLEPPNLWTDRLPRALAETGPRVVREQCTYRDAAGSERNTVADVWLYEDDRVPITQIHASAGVPRAELDGRPITFDDILPGCYEPAARLADMDRDNVEVSLCFPNLFVRFCGQRFVGARDEELALLCVRAYNDFLVEDWMEGSGGRLLGAAIAPLWDPMLAAAEVERIAARGLPAVCFSELPTKLNLPSLYSGEWEPFLSVCADTSTLVCVHIGSSSTGMTSSEDAPILINRFNHYCTSSLSLSDWIVSGVFVRHPNLKVLFAETQAGWIPYLLGRMDATWRRGVEFLERSWQLPEPPSSYMYDHFFACITEDPAAIDFIDRYGADNICFETDYPHPDSSWPNSMALAEELFGHLSEEQFTKITRTNAMRSLGLTDGI